MTPYTAWGTLILSAASLLLAVLIVGDTIKKSNVFSVPLTATTTNSAINTPKKPTIQKEAIARPELVQSNQKSAVFTNAQKIALLNKYRITSEGTYIGTTAPHHTQKNISQLGYAKTAFSGSHSERIHNIKLASSRINGKVIPIGGTFSTLRSVSPISEAGGYKSEYTIQGNLSVKAPGGGVCQISTTLFRAVTDAGLDTTERQAHSYVVSYYGAGLDATIFLPAPDYKFRNDTGSPVVVKSWVTGSTLHVAFFGVDDGRRVYVGTPQISNIKASLPTQYIKTATVPKGTTECKETPRKGKTATTYTSIAYPNKSKHEESIVSVYKPWGRKCFVGI